MKKGMCTWTWHQARMLTLLVPFLWWGSNASPSLTSQEASSDASIETMRADLLIVVGSAGEASYRDLFSEWAETLRTVADKAKVNVITLGPDTPSEGDGSLRKQVQSSLNELSRSAQAPLWLVFIGHGTFNGRTANFNLAGPDISQFATHRPSIGDDNDRVHTLLGHVEPTAALANLGLMVRRRVEVLWHEAIAGQRHSGVIVATRLTPQRDERFEHVP